MKEIKLSQRNKISSNNNLVAIVDDEDFDVLSQYKWHVKKTGNHFSARRWITQGKSISMHRQILGLANDDKRVVDHKDHNPLNNQKENLRICTAWQNNVYRTKFKGNSKFLGVNWYAATSKWVARIKIDGKQRQLGSFTDEESAAKCYDNMARKLYGEFANPNFK